MHAHAQPLARTHACENVATSNKACPAIMPQGKVWVACDELAPNKDAIDVLVTALSVDLLTDDDVHLHLLQLRELIGQAVYAIADQIEAKRGTNMQVSTCGCDLQLVEVPGALASVMLGV
eukprot:1143772-Pelagomonas_calceolata.AAC.1